MSQKKPDEHRFARWMAARLQVDALAATPPASPYSDDAPFSDDVFATSRIESLRAAFGPEAVVVDSPLSCEPRERAALRRHLGAPTPGGAALRPSDADALVRFVNIAARQGLQLVSPFSDAAVAPRDALPLDFSEFASVSAHENSGLVEIGPGATWDALEEAAQAAGMRAPRDGLARWSGPAQAALASQGLWLIDAEVVHAGGVESCRRLGLDPAAALCSGHGLPARLTLALPPRDHKERVVAWVFPSFDAGAQALMEAARRTPDFSAFLADAARGALDAVIYGGSSPGRERAVVRVHGFGPAPVLDLRFAELNVVFGRLGGRVRSMLAPRRVASPDTIGALVHANGCACVDIEVETPLADLAQTRQALCAALRAAAFEQRANETARAVVFAEARPLSGRRARVRVFGLVLRDERDPLGQWDRIHAPVRAAAERLSGGDGADERAGLQAALQTQDPFELLA